jgi:hypothetical protein
VNIHIDHAPKSEAIYTIGVRDLLALDSAVIDALANYKVRSRELAMLDYGSVASELGTLANKCAATYCANPRICIAEGDCLPN